MADLEGDVQGCTGTPFGLHLALRSTDDKLKVVNPPLWLQN